MTYSFDSCGWFNAADIPGRHTDIAPPVVTGSPAVGQPWPNFTGTGWVMVNYAAPVPQPAKPRQPISKVVVLSRVTSTEWANFTGSTDQNVRYAKAVFDAAAEVNPDDVITQTLFGVLTAAGILAVGRTAQILV